MSEPFNGIKKKPCCFTIPLKRNTVNLPPSCYCDGREDAGGKVYICAFHYLVLANQKKKKKNYGLNRLKVL